MSEHQIPEEIRLQNGRAALTLVYGGEHKTLPAEFLRVYSPSAEVRGHALGQEVLQTGKAGVTIMGLEPVGQYALKITFSDGHDSGLYDWPYLHQLAYRYDEMWADYLRRIELAGASRIPAAEGSDAQAEAGRSCGGGGCGCSH
ncbi:gamma-butyrobetaine hydroxylase-like domain-containing protein [Neisseria sp. CCUG12390]|uniref:gamma-butyrobetaine hydroxylase-like domain-containing protein n=1 Tax=Neisseria sp. CCUG12390 TaxID=3392035 RepID=UPI003A0FD0F2